MRYLFLAFLLLSSGVFAAIPQTAEDWYKPDSWTMTKVDATWIDAKNNECGAWIDAEGNVWWNKLPNDPNVQKSLEYALMSYQIAHDNVDRIKALGENLHAVFKTDGIKISGKAPDGSNMSFTIKFQDGIGSSSTIQGTTDAFGFPTHDGKSLNLLKGNKYEIKGWGGQANTQTSWWELDAGAAMVRLVPGSDSVWYVPIKGVDKLSLTPNESTKQLEISGWSKGDSANNRTLAESLTREQKDLFDNYKLVVRNNSGGVNYIPLGTINTNSTEIVVDEKSITKITETNEDGEESSKLALMGFDESPATEGIDASSVFPYKASNKLAWSPFLSFFSDGIFKKNSKNQISLRGLDTISEGTRIVTASGNGGEPQLGASDLKDMIDKPLAVENKKITIEGWNSNKDGNLFDASGCEVVVRDNGKMKFKTFGGTDGSSVNLTDDGKLQLKDWKTATPCSETISKMLTNPNDPNRDTHQLLAKVGNDLHYVSMGEVIPTNAVAEVDEVSIEKTTNDDGKEVLSLYGFGNGGTETNPYIPSEIDGLLSWKSVISFFNENMFDLNEGKIIIKGLDGDDEEIRILTVKGGDNGAAITSNSMKTFIDPPLEWRENKITVSGYDVAQEGEYLCRSKTGVEWKKVEDGILADEKSVTTNATPKAFALAGFGDAKENDIPFRDSSKLNWKPLTDFLDTTVDNKSIRLNDKDDLEVAGASNVSSPRKYFGSSPTTSQIGWYDLPNVTTNNVDVDEITLTTTTSKDGKTKTISWKTTPGAIASFARMGDGGIEWIPYDGVTNENAIVGVDGVSIVTNDNGKLEIKGWGTQGVCSADLSTMLTDTNDSNRDDHEILCRVNGQIHYLPLNQGVIEQLEVDGDTIVYKGDGTIGLDGSYNADPGTVPTRTSSGLKWEKVETKEIVGDDETIAVDTDYYNGTKTIKLKSKPGKTPSLAKMTENGLEWESIENITNKLAAAMLTDNVTIVTNGEGEVAIKGFADQSNCSAEIAEMLVNPDYSDRNNHSVLCRYGEGESATIHYLPFNDILGNSLADDKTITVKDDGKLVLYGFQNADSGWFPVRSGQELEWKKVPEIVAGKGVTVNPTGNGDYEVSLTNVCECVQHDRPRIDDESIVEIDGVWAVNTNYLAGVIADAEGNAIKPDNNTILINEEAKQFYVNPTIIPTVDADTLIEKSDGTIGLANSYAAAPDSVPTRSDNGLTWIEPTEATFVVDVIWDEQTKTIKKKTATYKIYGMLLTEDEDYQ